MSLPKNASTPMMHNGHYSGELDSSKELEAEEAVYFQSLIGIRDGEDGHMYGNISAVIIRGITEEGPHAASLAHLWVPEDKPQRQGNL